MIRFIVFLAFITLSNILIAQNRTGTGVFVNGIEMQQQVITNLENYYRVKVQKGRYWYDARCGLWGLEGDKALGVMLPNLRFGRLKANASNGRTGIFINGRQINRAERLQWHQLLGNTIPGRYVLDQYGNLSTEQGMYVCNVVQVARARSGGSNGSFYRNWYTGNGGGGDSSGFYIMGEDWSYSSF